MRSPAGGEIAVRAGGYGIPFEVVDGNDVWAVHEAAGDAIERARGGDGPTLLECRTYRHFGHSKSDPAPYRPEGELDDWKERDPLTLTRQRLAAEGVDEERLAAVEHEVEERMKAATEEALAAPYPDPA